jgi:beta-lactamase superfamily II metal-dependent hydrolase
MLFTGDAEWAAETALLASGAELQCDFLKVGHHGSRTACLDAFLRATAPRIAAISCAVDNDYGFPHEEVLDALRAVGAAVYRTDEQGTLRFLCDGKSIVYEE